MGWKEYFFIELDKVNSLFTYIFLKKYYTYLIVFKYILIFFIYVKVIISFYCQPQVLLQMTKLSKLLDQT